MYRCNIQCRCISIHYIHTCNVYGCKDIYIIYRLAARKMGDESRSWFGESVSMVNAYMVM